MCHVEVVAIVFQFKAMWHERVLTSFPKFRILWRRKELRMLFLASMLGGYFVFLHCGMPNVEFSGLRGCLRRSAGTPGWASLTYRS